MRMQHKDTMIVFRYTLTCIWKSVVHITWSYSRFSILAVYIGTEPI